MGRVLNFAGIAERKVTEIEERVRKTICDSYRLEPSGLIKTTEGRILADDFEYLLELAQRATRRIR